MATSEVATVRFMDQESGDDALAIVRSSTGLVSLALSLEHDGDIEVTLTVSDARSLLLAIQTALDKSTA